MGGDEIGLFSNRFKLFYNVKVNGFALLNGFGSSFQIQPFRDTLNKPVSTTLVNVSFNLQTSSV